MTNIEGQYRHPAKVVSASIRQITEGPRVKSGGKDALTKLEKEVSKIRDEAETVPDLTTSLTW